MRKIVVFGATGYTGELTVEALVKRGLKPILAGRNASRLNEIAKRFGLSYRLADVSDLESVKSLVEKDDILISTVGPFMRYGRTAVEAAVAKGAHYIDSTGEPEFVRCVVDEFDHLAKQSGSCLLTAAAYDYFPGNCAAAQALEMAGDDATRVDIGYYGVGKDRLVLSDGTKESIINIMTVPGLFWRNGLLVKDFGGTRLRRFTVANKSRAAISVSTSEGFFLPKSFPHVKDINVYLGWFGVASYLLQFMAITSSMFLKLPGSGKLLQKIQPFLFKSKGKGPDKEARDRGASQVQAIAYNKEGKVLSQFELEGVHGYTFTANMLAWVAEQLSQHEVTQSGALGPVEVFGASGLLEACEESGLMAVSERSLSYGYR